MCVQKGNIKNMNFNVECWHSDDPEAPGIVHDTATNDRNEAAFGGGVLLLTVGDRPVVAAAVGEDEINPALNEVRKVVAGEAMLELSEEERQQGLSHLAETIVHHSGLLANGTVFRPGDEKVDGVSANEFANAFPDAKNKRDINGVVVVQAPGYGELVSNY